MLSNWLTRGGLVQVVAPDINFKVKEQEEADHGTVRGLLDDFFSVVAPDPNFSPSIRTNDSTNMQNDDNNNNNHVQCIHCQRWTPIQNPLLLTALPTTTTATTEPPIVMETPYFTPRKPHMVVDGVASASDFSNIPQDELLRMNVLSAAVDLAKSISSPTATWEPIKNFFNLCASTTALTTKQLSKLQKQLDKDPSLLYARSSKMGNVATDGFAPIHAAAYAGNVPVVELLIQFQPKVVHILDVQGRTALHVASERGHVQIVTLLKHAMSMTTQQQQQEETCGGTNTSSSNIKYPIGQDAPVDLSGRTPLAWAATSSASLAVRNRIKLEQELFSPDDKSIVGMFTPPSFRMGGDRLMMRMKPTMTTTTTTINQSKANNISSPSIIMASAPQQPQIRMNKDRLAITYGFSEMPGLRVTMEDAMCYHYPLKLPIETGSIVGFFGVFDGHGDGGFVSRFVAEHIAQYFIEVDIWKSIDPSSSSSTNLFYEPSDPDHNHDSRHSYMVSIISKALEAACIQVDKELRKVYDAKGANITAGGSTGVMAVITTDSIVVANVGDSRCILIQKPRESISDKEQDMLGVKALDKEFNDLNLKDESDEEIVVMALSTDHKPNLPKELQRIVKAGYEVVPDRLQSDHENCNDSLIWKIKKSDNDKIAVSRAFGDFDYKANANVEAHEQAIICIPEITVHQRNANLDMLLVLACDGVYDVMENYDIGQYIVKTTKDSSSTAIIPEAADLLLKKCLERGSRDNMSVMIISFSSQVAFVGATPTINPKALSFVDE